jgi:glycosyltransferase involved in cell wall biosynthesis
MGSLKSNIEVERSYLLSDVVIHPSFVESFPQTFTEAMRYGKPLISADLPYAREIAGKSSLFFKPEDPVDLLNAIEKYINNENFMNEMSIKSKNRGDFFKPVLNWNKLYKIIKNSVQK